MQKKLKNAGIQVIHDLPGVGENLQDHLEFNFQYRCKQPITLNGQISLLKKLKIGIEWIITKRVLGHPIILRHAVLSGQRLE